MDAWNLIRATVREAYPDLTENEVYEITKGVVLLKLGIHHSTGETK